MTFVLLGAAIAAAIAAVVYCCRLSREHRAAHAALAERLRRLP